MAELEMELGASESWTSALTAQPQFPLLRLALGVMWKPTHTSTLLIKRGNFQWGQMDTQGQMLS